MAAPSVVEVRLLGAALVAAASPVPAASEATVAGPSRSSAPAVDDHVDDRRDDHHGAPTTTTAPPPPAPPRPRPDPTRHGSSRPRPGCPTPARGRWCCTTRPIASRRIGFHQSARDGAQEQAPLASAVPWFTMESRGPRHHRPRRRRHRRRARPGDPRAGHRHGDPGRHLHAVLRPRRPVRGDRARRPTRLGGEGPPHRGPRRSSTGQRVEAGVTRLAAHARVLPFPSQVEEYTGLPPWPHVHVEVVDPTLPDRPTEPRLLPRSVRRSLRRWCAASRPQIVTEAHDACSPSPAVGRPRTSAASWLPTAVVS